MIGNSYKGSSFKGLLDYLFYGRDDDPNPHRVEWHETRNLPIDDPDALPRILRATASLSTSVKQPVYHLPISWPPEERPDRETQLEIADQLLADLRLSEHQCVIVAHNDGDCSHIHLVINRVHPDTGRVWNAWRDIYRIMESLERQERERGMRLVPRPPLEEYRGMTSDPVRRKNASRGERQRAEREGQEPLRPWSEHQMRDVRKAVTKHFRDADSWEDLDGRLRRHGLELQWAGQGLRLTDGNTFMQLSKIGKHARWQDMETRFGRTWVEHEATRPLTRGEQQSVEAPLVIGRGGPDPTKVGLERAAKLIDAWRAYEQYQRFIVRERDVADDGVRLIRLRRQLRANEALADTVDEELAQAKGDYLTVMRAIYKNPKRAMDKLKAQLRADKDWPDIDLHKIGKVKGISILGRNNPARKEAERQMRRVKVTFTRGYRLEAQLKSLVQDWDMINAKISSQQRAFELGHRGSGRPLIPPS